MAAQDLERLVVQLSADVRKFENAMSKAQGVTEKRARAIESRFSKMNKGVSASFAKLATRAGAGLAAIGVAGLIAGFREVASSVAEIGSEAQRAGLSSKSFQELKFAAEQSRVSVDALTDGMKELSLRTDEFIVSGGKSGSAAEAFQRLGYTVDDLKTKIQDPSALLTEIIGKVQKLDKAAQVRIFDELFGGTGGEQFVRFIGQGEEGVRSMIKAANDLGIVIDDEVIKRAAEVDAKFNAIATTIGSNLKAAVVDAFSALSQFVDAYRDVQNQASSTIDSRIAELGMRRLDLENDKLQSGGNDRLSRRRSAVIDQQLRELAAEEAALVNERNKRVTLEPIVLQSGGADDGSYNAGLAPASSASKGSKKEDPYKRMAASLREQIALLEAQTAAQAGVNPLIDDYGFAVEHAAAKQDLLNAALEGGKTVTPALASEIDALATAYANSVVEAAKLAETQDEIRQRAEEAREFNKDLTRGLIDGFTEGKDAADIFADSLKKIGDRLLDMALDDLFSPKAGGGLLSSIFGGLSGIGKRERGGPVSAGKPYIVGEKRPELFVPNTSGTIIPKIPSLAGRSGSGGVSAPVSISIDARGADGAGLARVEQQIATLKAELPGRIVSTVREGQKRRQI